MAGHHGRFCWYELMTSDQADASAFYSAVVGWRAVDAGYPGQPYSLMMAGADRVGGIMTMPEAARQAGMPPYWLGYVAVDDVDAAVAQARSSGSSIVHGPSDLPVGRFALVRDPQGAAIYLFKGMGDAGAKPITDLPGYVGWRELLTADLGAGVAFYQAMFGWTPSSAIDMGPMGVYQLFAERGEDIGGMMRRPPSMPVSRWNYYFTVDAADAAVARIEQQGGTVTSGPHQVPGGQWAVQGSDRQGAPFALVSRAA
jgi:predicted enzyme related to lactoylglutathione lyase